MTSLANVEIVIVAVLLPLAWVTVSLRLWVRTQMTKSLGWDDGAMLVALLLYTLLCAFLLAIVAEGGFQTLTVTENLGQIITFVLLSETFYILTTTCLKVALGLFFLRILDKSWQKYTFYVILSVSVVYGTCYTGLAIFQCGLPTDLLKHVISGRGCVPTAVSLASGYTYGALNVIADWTFVIIPIFMLAESSMDRRSKISVAIIMVFGALGSVSSVIRMNYVKGVLFGLDFFQDAANLGIWSTIEPGVGIAACSLATLRPLMRRAVQMARRTVTNAYASRNGHRSRNRGRGALSTDGFEPLDDESYIMTSVSEGNRKFTSSQASHQDYRSPSESRWHGSMGNTQISKVVDVRVTSEEVNHVGRAV